jgi:K+/H+ antiporter YhaU regulatory subunit KhtT
MAGKSLAALHIRSLTGCSVIAVESNGSRVVNPAAGYVLPREGNMILVGTVEAEQRFLTVFQPELQSVLKRKKT